MEISTNKYDGIRIELWRRLSDLYPIITTCIGDTFRQERQQWACQNRLYCSSSIRMQGTGSEDSVSQTNQLSQARLCSPFHHHFLFSEARIHMSMVLLLIDWDIKLGVRLHSMLQYLPSNLVQYNTAGMPGRVRSQHDAAINIA